MSGGAALLFAQHNKAWVEKQSGASPRPVTHRGYQAPVAASRASDSPDTPIMLAALENDTQRLHEINSISRKQEVKRAELIPRYRDYLAKHIAAGKKPGAVLVRNMIWAFDALDLDHGMTLAAYIDSKGGATMPEGFRRDFYNYWYATIGDTAVAQMRANEPITRHITTVYTDMIAHPERDIVDRIRAAVLSGQGGAVEVADPAAAAMLYEQAMELDPKCGMSRRLKQLRKPTNPATHTRAAAPSTLHHVAGVG